MSIDDMPVRNRRLTVSLTKPPAPGFAIVALVGLAGCGGGPVPIYPVVGEVRLDGNPIGDRIAGATVLFEPTEEAQDGKVYSARGLIDEQGHYELTTFSAGDGAMAGRHRVAVVVHSGSAGVYEDKDQPGAPPRRVVPVHYASIKTSGLEVEVLPQSNHLNLDLKTSP